MKGTKQKFVFVALKDCVGICKLNVRELIPPWAYQGVFFSITKTAEELSIVCSESAIPPNAVHEKDWKVLKISGILNFSLVGILAQVSAVLAEAGVSIFAVSTYNTDYVLVRNVDFDTAVSALRDNGNEVLFDED